MTGNDLKAAMAEIGARIEEAADVLKRLPDRERAYLHDRGQQWPLMLRRVWEDAPKEKVTLRRPPPTAKQIDRMNEVLDWLLALAKQQRDYFRAVWLCCAERKKPAEVARIIGIHRATVYVWRDNGLRRIVEHMSHRRAA